VLKKIKQTVLMSARGLGISDFLGNSKWRQNKLLIVGYHGVSLADEEEWNRELFMSPRQLRQRFELIRRKGCTVLPLSDAIERLYNGTLPKKAVSITFDDGLFNFYKEAVPLLKEFDFHATLYAATFYVEYNNPVFGVATDYLLWKGRSEKLDCSSLIDLDEVFDLSIEGERKRALSSINDYVIKNDLSAQQKNGLLEELCSALGIDFGEFCDSRVLQLMTPDELGSVARSGFDVELHTHRHRAPLDEHLFGREISDNRRAIERATLRRPTHFCYPNGAYDSRYLPWLEKSDVISATTCESALAERRSNRLLLPRLIDTGSLSQLEFEGWLDGISHFFPQR
jgi:peptidoglycan/xylan/chitin deacetylase (PgdA/CDA1 family)